MNSNEGLDKYKKDINNVIQWKKREKNWVHLLTILFFLFFPFDIVLVLTLNLSLTQIFSYTAPIFIVIVIILIIKDWSLHLVNDHCRLPFPPSQTPEEKLKRRTRVRNELMLLIPGTMTFLLCLEMSLLSPWNWSIFYLLIVGLSLIIFGVLYASYRGTKPEPELNKRNKNYHQKKIREIVFQCAICQRMKSTVQSIPKCIVCNRSICNQCNRGDFCVDHFNELSLSDQQTYLELQTKMKKKQWSDKKTLLMLFLSVVFVIGCAYLGKIYFFTWNILWVFPLAFSAPFLPWIYASIYNKKFKQFKKAHHEFTITLLKTYKFTKIKPLESPFSVDPYYTPAAPPEQEISSPQYNTNYLPATNDSNLSTLRKCRGCGYVNTNPDIHFCMNCGLPLPS